MLAQAKELESQIPQFAVNDFDNFTNDTLFISAKDQATVFNALGAAYFFLTDYELAQKYFLQAMKVFEKIDAPRGIFAAYNNLSLISWALHESSRAIELSNQALAIVNKLEDEKNILLVTANIGRYQSALEQFDNALSTFDKVLNHKNISNYPNIKIGTLLSKASNLQSQNLFNQSENVIREALQLSIDTKNKINISRAKVAC